MSLDKNNIRKAQAYNNITYLYYITLIICCKENATALHLLLWFHVTDFKLKLILLSSFSKVQHLFFTSFSFLQFLIYLWEKSEQGCKEKFSGYAKRKKYSIMRVNVESSGCAGAHPQLHVDKPMRGRNASRVEVEVGLQGGDTTL